MGVGERGDFFKRPQIAVIEGRVRQLDQYLVFHRLRPGHIDNLKGMVLSFENGCLHCLELHYAVPAEWIGRRTGADIKQALFHAKLNAIGRHSRQLIIGLVNMNN